MAAAVLIALGLGVLLTGASGAVAALGDTLYPSGSLAEGLRADLSATSHALIRLRVLAPRHRGHGRRARAAGGATTRPSRLMLPASALRAC